MKGLLQSCLLFALAAICTADDSSTALTAAIKNGKPTRVFADGCGFKLLVPKRCTFKLQQFPNSTEQACGFTKLGQKVLLEEAVDFVRGACQDGLSLTNMVKGNEEVDWEFTLYRMHNRKVTGATGRLKELKFNDIILTPAIKGVASLVGLNLEDLHIPGSVRNASIFATYEEKTKDLMMGFGGTHGPCAAHVVTTFKKSSKKLGAALGVTCSNAKLVSFLAHFGGGGLNLDFLAKAQYSVMLSTTDIRATDGRFFFRKAKHLAYMTNTTEGVNLVVTLGRPTDCKSDFCKLLQEILQRDNNLRIHGAVKGKADFKLTALLPFNHTINNNLKLKNIVLKIETKPIELALTVNVEIQKPKLLLSGGFHAGQKGFGLQASMGHVWYNPFDLPYVAFGDVILTVTFIPAHPVPSAFQLGGKLFLGRNETGKLLEAQAYIGIDTTNPTENYFYAHINMTVQRLLDAFGIKADIPDVIGESGFPDMRASYTTLFKGKTLTEINLEIPHGLHINGTMNVLGLEATCDVHFNFKLHDILVFLNITLPVVNLGGVASFRSAKDKDIGAHAFVSFKEGDLKGAKAVFEGRLELFGKSRYALMHVNLSQFEVIIGESLFFFNAEMVVRAQYGNIEEAQFTVSASITSDNMKELSAILKNELLKIYNDGKRALQTAHDDLEKVKAECERTAKTLKCKDCDGAQHDICDTVVTDPCKVACHVVFWNVGGCKRDCDSARRDCKKALNEVCNHGCNAAAGIGHSLCQTLDVAKAAVSDAKKYLGDIADISIVGLKALEIFNLNRLRFETGLSAKARAKFHCELDVVVFKKPFHLKHKLNLKLLSEGDLETIGKLFEFIFEHVKDKLLLPLPLNILS